MDDDYNCSFWDKLGFASIPFAIITILFARSATLPIEGLNFPTFIFFTLYIVISLTAVVTMALEKKVTLLLVPFIPGAAIAFFIYSPLLVVRLIAVLLSIVIMFVVERLNSVTLVKWNGDVGV